MTVAATLTQRQYTGTGTSAQFSFPNKIFSAGDLVIIIYDTLGNAYPFVNFANPTLGWTYSVQNVDVDTGCIVVLSNVLTSGWVLDIRSLIPELQSTSVKNQGQFLPELHEEAFDRATRMIQDLLRLTYTFGIHGPDTEFAPWPALPGATARKGQALMFDAVTGLPALGTPTTAVLTQALFNTFFAGSSSYLLTLGETNAGVTPVNFAYLPGDLRRYGCDITGATDNTTQITNAINAAVATGGQGFIYHPGGTISHASQITIPNNLTVLGFDRAKCIFQFTGTPSGAAPTRAAWRYTGIAPWSGYANVAFHHVKIFYQNVVNFAAGIELSAWGWAYFELDDIWVTGNCSYGVILDGTEITSLHNSLIENVNALATAANVWIVNGADRGFNPSGGSPLGFSNVITIRDNQISGSNTMYGVADDGGNNHSITANNFNAHRFPTSLAGINSLALVGDSLETASVNGSANAFFSTLSLNGNNVGPCTNGIVQAIGFYGNMAAGSLLTFNSSTYTITGITQAASAVITFNTVSTTNPFFAGCPINFSGVSGMTQINGQGGVITAIGGVSGAWTVTVPINSTAYTAYASGGTITMFHTGFSVTGCIFGSQLGRGSAIDVTNLGNSFCGNNTDLGSSGMFHYTGVHFDTNGNTLLPPQNSSAVIVNINGPVNCDTRFQQLYQQGVVNKRVSLTYSASITPDCKQGNTFTISVTNGTAFTINTPLNPLDGQTIKFLIRNTFGAMGAITWNAVFKLSAFTNPAANFSRAIEFEYDGANWVQKFQATVDVPN